MQPGPSTALRTKTVCRTRRCILGYRPRKPTAKSLGESSPRSAASVEHSRPQNLQVMSRQARSWSSYGTTVFKVRLRRGAFWGDTGIARTPDNPCFYPVLQSRVHAGTAGHSTNSRHHAPRVRHSRDTGRLVKCAWVRREGCQPPVIRVASLEANTCLHISALVRQRTSGAIDHARSGRVRKVDEDCWRFDFTQPDEIPARATHRLWRERTVNLT